MSRVAFKQSQITRAVKAVRAAGIPVGRVAIAPDGTVNVYSGLEKIDTDENALDEWMKRNACKD
jgi:hypothetical protein